MGLVREMVPYLRGSGDRLRVSFLLRPAFPALRLPSPCFHRSCSKRARRATSLSVNEKEIDPRFGIRSHPISRTMSPVDAAWLRQDARRSGVRSDHRAIRGSAGDMPAVSSCRESGGGAPRRRPHRLRRAVRRGGRSAPARARRVRAGAIRQARLTKCRSSSRTMPSLLVRLTTTGVAGRIVRRNLRDDDGRLVRILDAHVLVGQVLDRLCCFDPAAGEGGVAWRGGCPSPRARAPPRGVALGARLRQDPTPSSRRATGLRCGRVRPAGPAGPRAGRPAVHRPPRARCGAESYRPDRRRVVGEAVPGAALVDVVAVDAHRVGRVGRQLVGPEQLPQVGIEPRWARQRSGFATRRRMRCTFTTTSQNVGSVVTADCDEVIGSPEAGLYKALWVSGIGLEDECTMLADMPRRSGSTRSRRRERPFDRRPVASGRRPVRWRWLRPPRCGGG